jgi:hypothetical protein
MARVKLDKTKTIRSKSSKSTRDLDENNNEKIKKGRSKSVMLKQAISHGRPQRVALRSVECFAID